MTQMIMNTNRRMQMAYNPKTYNLFQQIDISNALEKARKHLDETEEESPSICIKSDKPFALAMRFARYIKAFNEQTKSVEGVDEAKYNFLIFQCRCFFLQKQYWHLSQHLFRSWCHERKKLSQGLKLLCQTP